MRGREARRKSKKREREHADNWYAKRDIVERSEKETEKVNKKYTSQAHCTRGSKGEEERQEERVKKKVCG